MHRLEKIELENGGWVTVEDARKARIVVDIFLGGEHVKKAISANRAKGLVAELTNPFSIGNGRTTEIRIIRGKVEFHNIRSI